MRENWRLHFRRDVDRLVGDLGTEVANGKKARGVQMAICAFRGWEVFLAEEGKGGPLGPGSDPAGAGTAPSRALTVSPWHSLARRSHLSESPVFKIQTKHM